MDSDKPSVEPLEGVRNVYVVSSEGDAAIVDLVRRLGAFGSPERSVVFDKKDEAMAYATLMQAAAANTDAKGSQAKSKSTQTPVPKATDA